MVSMLGGLTQGADFIDNMSSVFPELLQFARAGGVAIVVDDRVLTLRRHAAGRDRSRDLVAWLSTKAHGDIFHTDNLASAVPGRRRR